MNIKDDLLREKLIVIVRGVQSDKLIPLAQAVYDGGIRFLEITYSADGKVSDSETASNIKSLVEHFGDKMHIGAGTVLTEEQVLLTKAAGGKFIISPDADIDVIKKTKEMDLISIPGAFTASEIKQAYKAGADFVKLFPITQMGPDYVKAIKAPLSHIPLLAVGGVDISNMNKFLEAGVCGFGIGTNITNKKMIEENDFEGITALAKEYVAVIKDE
ncbi:MAG: bifunctional 4-hydroxy-2-oxoglutarate aldolase/2-dehydro-3-deoxy-phosphogluconate aldolase [Firmicutes bacterium]|nr:bifunctional 4-hydroxy-2-oxoglutarate aldolase/2-dehydro-3-deoxy-phosphogluconate aldolase [Bacillota bacterium]